MAFYKILISLVFITTLMFGANVDNLRIMTEDSPKSNMLVDKKLTGYAVDILELMLQRSNSKLTKNDFEVLPWARGYSIVQNEPNTMLFAMLRTQQREKLFKWVGPINSSVVGLIARKDTNITINSPKDIKKYKIGSVKNDVGELSLHEIGITDTDSISGVNAIEKSLKKLDHGRIDLFVYSYSGVDDFAKDKYEKVYTLKQDDLYFALHKNTDQKIINTLQNALNSLKEEGIVEKIVLKYK